MGGMRGNHIGNRESGIGNREHPRDAPRGESDIPRVLLLPIPDSLFPIPIHRLAQHSPSAGLSHPDRNRSSRYQDPLTSSGPADPVADRRKDICAALLQQSPAPAEFPPTHFVEPPSGSTTAAPTPNTSGSTRAAPPDSATRDSA